MVFKRKLATLRQPEASEQAPASTSESATVTRVADVPARSSTLAELRQKMAEILENPGLAAVGPAGGASAEPGTVPEFRHGVAVRP